MPRLDGIDPAAGVPPDFVACSMRSRARTPDGGGRDKHFPPAIGNPTLLGMVRFSPPRSPCAPKANRHPSGGTRIAQP